MSRPCGARPPSRSISSGNAPAANGRRKLGNGRSESAVPILLLRAPLDLVFPGALLERTIFMPSFRSPRVLEEKDDDKAGVRRSVLFLLPDAESSGRKFPFPRIAAVAAWRARQLWVIHVTIGTRPRPL